MENNVKGKSPFYPGQPVPIEFFTGRMSEVQRIIRAIGQVELGKSQAIFLTGEYGIGKSSLASYMRYYAENQNHLFGIHVFLGGAETLEDVATKTVESVIKSQLYKLKLNEKIRNFLSKYIGSQELMGFSINLEALKADGLNISHGYLPFLHDLLEKVNEEGIKGILLILDEINGITKDAQFAHFIKTLVDENAVSNNPVPLLLMLCGVDERRKDMIQHHQPIERIFDLVEIKPMNEIEMIEFFTKSFDSVNIKIEQSAMKLMCHYSAGFPKIMHMIGDNIFWIDRDNRIDENDALEGVLITATDIGKKFVDQQVYKALHSSDYHSVLAKLCKEQFDLAFKKSAIEKGLTDSEKKKYNNFLQRMKGLGVLSSGDKKGEYVFNSRLVRLYILLKSAKKSIIKEEK